MTESSALPHGQDSSANMDPQISSEALSHLRISQLDAASESLHVELPEYIGMTVFGSIARLEATPDSDADLFVFLRPGDEYNLQHEPRVTEGNQLVVSAGAQIGTIVFDTYINMQYDRTLQKTITATGVNDPHIIILPLDEHIIDQTSKTLLDIAKTWDEGDKSIGALVPRNIRALFHVPTGDSDLQLFMEQALGILKASPHSNTAWAMIRHNVLSFEKGRGQQDIDLVTHRYLPKTLGEALAYYSTRSPTEN